MTVNRETTVPFHLKLFYHKHAYHTLNDFPIPTPTGPNSNNHLPPHLEIYTWQSCTLRELSSLLAGALPSQLPSPQSGTRLCFRLIYPDTRGAATEGRGRYLSKDIGSVILGQSSKDESTADDAHMNGDRRRGPDKGPLRLDEADKTLADARFVIGDYVDVAILPPLDDGSVAPPVQGGRGPPGGPLGGGMRAFGPPRDNGGRRGGMGRGNGIPSGDWKRGERLPAEERGGGWPRRRGGY
ncbi:uncharacterized protein TRUGW13939_08712 [Talaromyces rugulosus]|uniref:Sin3-associated polypeptide Sap18 n=1 Tax=Talaromyces rugulosus TaxID=121627 RepID=A0A7H8R5B7_TALRU|nr:uncharacterized protein TRUGW13939_08712 [Talaromyces rugulosus]QKX61560.1 hypothetical protein TRUGW13939_08712 [Talaromyces rugulosus]